VAHFHMFDLTSPSPLKMPWLSSTGNKHLGCYKDGENLATCSIHTKGHLSKKEKWRWQLYVAKKRERKENMIYIYIYEKRKKERAKQRERKRKWYIKKRERKGAVRQCSYSRPFPLPPRPMVYAHYLCVWPRPSYSPEKDHVRSSHRCSSFKHDPHMLPVKTLRYAKVNKMFTNSLTHICLHEIIHIHASVVYVMCSSLGVHT